MDSDPPLLPADSQIETIIETKGAGKTEPKEALRTRPLSSGQERRLTTYLDDKFLELTRGYKKRSQPTSTLRTLHAYLAATRNLLAFILQIPPVDPSTGLRVMYMLRLTGDIFGSIVGYPLVNQPPTTDAETGNVNEADSSAMDTSLDSSSTAASTGDEPMDPRSILIELIDFLDDLDQAWLAVLQCQVWDPNEGAGVDLVLDTTINGSSAKSTPMSQTDIARLRSLLVGGEEVLEEWLEEERISMSGRSTNRGDGENVEEDVTALLSRWGLLGDFDELFHRTLDYLGGFSGEVEPQSEVT